MMPESSPLTESGTTERASERFGITMGERVTVQFVFLSKAFPTIDAHVRSLTGVFKFVLR